MLSAVLLATSLTGCFAAGTGQAAGSGAASARIQLAMMQPPRSGLTPLSDDAFKHARWKTAETLVVLDELGEAQPALATGWEQVDGTAWRFTVRQGVSFHDGTNLTPAEVAASITAATQASPKPRILDGVELTVETDGNDAVIVRTATPDPLLHQRLSSPQLAVFVAAAYKEGGVVGRLLGREGRGAGRGCPVRSGRNREGCGAPDRKRRRRRGHPGGTGGPDRPCPGA